MREALTECNKTFFPNIKTLLQLACTIPVSSNACERSNSALRRLHTYNRASMGEERLSNLALVHVHYGKKVNLNDVIDLFAKKHPRRMELEEIL